MDVAAWTAERRRDSGERAVAAYVVRRLLGDPRVEAAAALGYRSASSVAHAERRVTGSHPLQEWAEDVAAKIEL